MGIIVDMDASSGPAAPAVNDARRLVRDAARALPARARAGVLRPDRRRHLRLPRAAGRAARVPVPRAEPDPVALDARLRPAGRHHRRPARAAVRRERARPDRAAARARVHRRSAPDAARGLSRDPARGPDRASSGFNPFSLFGAKRYFGRAQTPPWNGNFIALYRLKDWLTLLGFDVVGGRLDGYVPPFAQREVAAPLRVLRDDRRPLVADRRRRLLPARDQEACSGMRVITPAWERRERRKKALGARRARTRRAHDVRTGSHAVSTVVDLHRRRLQGQSRSRRLGRAAARPARTSASSSAARRTPPTTGWSSPPSSARSRR